MIDIAWQEEIIAALIEKDKNVTIGDYLDLLKEIEAIRSATLATYGFKSKAQLETYIISLKHAS